MRVIWRTHQHLDTPRGTDCVCNWLETEHIVREAMCLTQIRKLRLEYVKSA